MTCIVWIAAIASSRTRLATLTGAMCKTSQCELRSLRVNSGMLNVIRIVTYYTLPPLESPDSFWIAMAISRQRPMALGVLNAIGNETCRRDVTLLYFVGLLESSSLGYIRFDPKQIATECLSS